ncbi:hypothetical protein T06_10748 [Trichinella sp. T6]|nr:hypothetical protein T06_10748 [Trichinella sp. T6]
MRDIHILVSYCFRQCSCSPSVIICQVVLAGLRSPGGYLRIALGWETVLSAGSPLTCLFALKLTLIKQIVRWIGDGGRAWGVIKFFSISRSQQPEFVMLQ